MKKRNVIYGVAGMMEYVAIIKLGRSQMKIVFTDGSINAMGMNPATYSTGNPMIQHAIENSDQYKRGRIYTVRAVESEEDVHVVSNPMRETKKEKSEGIEIPGESLQETSAEEVEGLTEMEFDNNDDAKDFLESKFGCVRTKLHNRAEIIAAGKVNGISIIFS